MADPRLLDLPALADHLLAGGIAGFPTDTVPALAALPAAAGPLWELKRRPAGKPFILMAATAAELLEALGQPPPEGWEVLVRRGWPGALTLVLPARGAVAEALNPCGGSLGLVSRGSVTFGPQQFNGNIDVSADLGGQSTAFRNQISGRRLGGC